VLDKFDHKYCIEYTTANLVHTTRFWNKLSQVHSKSKDWKAK